MSLLVAERLRAAYGRREVLSGVDLRIEPGEIVALIGPNGAGKSTVLASIMGLTRARGAVAFRGRPILGLAPEQVARLGIALVPQGRRLFSTLTVRQNLRLGAYARSSRTSLAADIERCLERFPALGERQDQQARTLSGGEQQMLALARALLLRPAVLLLDEPSLGLAPRAAADVLRLVSQINTAEGTAVLVVEQNVTLVRRFASRAYLMEAGRVAREGDAAQVAGDDAVRRAYLGY